jgi:hypothetical protein
MVLIPLWPLIKGGLKESPKKQGLAESANKPLQYLPKKVAI